MTVINRETILGSSLGIRYAYDNNKSVQNFITSFTKSRPPSKFSIKLRMSFGAELIGFSLALGTNDVVVTDKRSIVAPGGNLYVSVSCCAKFTHRTSRLPSHRTNTLRLYGVVNVGSPAVTYCPWSRARKQLTTVAKVYVSCYYSP